VSRFLDELNGAFADLDLRMEEVTLVHRGIVPAVRQGDGRLALAAREVVRDHERAGGPAGLISIAGTKYTTARAVAERVIDLALTKLGKRYVPCRTALTLLPGADGTSPPGVAPQLAAAYGSRASRVQALIEDRPDLRQPVADGSPVLG